MRALRLTLFLVLAAAPMALGQAPSSSENDHTMQAMKDEMARAKSRLELAIPPSNQPVRPYYIENRMLDMDIR